jgi:Protein of unknown function (DUF3040)
MALPMDEQRILEEMERMLAADDPRLASRLAAFGQPGVAQVLRTRRARAVLSLLTLGLIACVAAVIYMMDAFHQGGSPIAPHSTSSAQPTKSQTASRVVPIAGAPHCVLLIIAPQCTAWSSASGPAASGPAASGPAASTAKTANTAKAAGNPTDQASSQPTSSRQAGSQAAKP